MIAKLVVAIFFVIVFLFIYGGMVTYALRCVYLGLSERIDAEQKLRAALSLAVTRLEGQLAIEGVLPLWGQKFLNDQPNCGVVVDPYGHEHRLLSARVHDLELRLAQIDHPVANKDHHAA